MKYAINNKISPSEIKIFRKQFNLSRDDLAQILNVSKRTIESWENNSKDINGSVVSTITLIRNNPSLINKILINNKNKDSYRFYYMEGNYISTIIDVNYSLRTVEYKNYTNNLDAKAFGNKDIVSFDDFEEFLNSRCFPKSRDMLKVELERLDIPYYDPLLIIEKTNGRVDGDNYWLKIEGKND